MKTYLEYRDEKSSKFWEVTVADTTMTTRWGKLGSDGQSKEKSFGSNDEAITEAEKIAAQKVRKGYAPLDDQTSAPVETQADKPTSPEKKKRKVTNFEVLRDRWLQKSFPSISNDKFKEKFQQLLVDTLMNSKDFSPQTRAEIIKNMFKFHDKHLTYSGRYFQSVVNKAIKELFPAVIEVLSPGFKGEEVTVDLLSEAPNLEVLDSMLQAGINANSKFQSGIDSFTSFIDLKPKLFDRLVEAGANLDLLVDGKIRSDLLSYEYLEKIHEKGANLNVVDAAGKTPFFHCGYIVAATYRGVSISRKNTFNLLKKSGCEIDQIDNDGETPLSKELKEVADKNDYWPLKETCKDLIAAGASVNCPPNPVPLLFRLPKDVEPYNTQDVLVFIDLLIEKKIDLEEKDPRSGNTALHYWAGTDGKISRKICEKLLTGGAATCSLNSVGQTPLMYAAQQHAEKSWKLLLSKKADINARSANGYSASEWSVARGQEPSQSFLKLLLESKAPLEGSGSGCDLSLLGFLIQNNHYHSALLVIEHGGEITDWVIDTMTKQGPKGQEDALDAITAFIRSGGQRAQEALNTCHQGEIEKHLDDAPKVSTDDALEILSPKFWPPIFPERQPLVVLEVEGKKLESKLVFEDGEIEEYLNVDGHYVNHNVLHSNKDEEILERIHIKTRNRVPFDKYSQISDKAMTCSWNEIIASNQVILGRGYFWDGDISANEYKYLLARCGVSVVPSFLEIAKKKSNTMVRVMQPVADVKLAPIMATQFYRTPASRAVRKWLLRHPEHAIHGLVPLAVGKPGKQRDACEAALRYMAYQELEDEIIAICKLYGGDVIESVQEVLSVDHAIDYHLKESPEIPSRLLEAETSIPLVREASSPLTTDKLRALFGMMSLSSFDDVYPPLQRILPLLDLDTLSEFSWEIFQVWDEWCPEFMHAKQTKIKKEAEWMYHCLGYMGNDQTVKKLIPLIKSWPKSGGMNKAVTGLDILANSGSDFAIRSINSILLKTKYKPLLERASDIMDKVADVRGLTKAELDDRLVPTFGLDKPDSFVLDFGPRSFTIKINEKLVPALFDQEFMSIKDLPKPVKADEKSKAKEATEFWKGLKTDLKTEASTQLVRFEQSMLLGRQWSVADFRSLLVAHPVLCALVRHLVWGMVKDGKVGQLFRVNDEGECLNAKGQEVTLSDEVMVSIPHPLQIQKPLELWKAALAKNKLKQPFAQIGRQIYLKKQDKKKDLFGINGARAPAKVFRGLKAKGWIAEIGDAGAIWSYEKNLSDGRAHIGFEGIVTMHDYGIDEDQTLEVTISGKPTDLEYSEVVREIKDLLH